MSTAADQTIPASDLSAVRCIVEAIRLAADTDGSDHLVRLCNALLHETTAYVLAVSGRPVSRVSAPSRGAAFGHRFPGHRPHRGAPSAADDPSDDHDERRGTQGEPVRERDPRGPR